MNMILEKFLKRVRGWIWCTVPKCCQYNNVSLWESVPFDFHWTWRSSNNKHTYLAILSEIKISVSVFEMVELGLHPSGIFLKCPVPVVLWYRKGEVYISDLFQRTISGFHMFWIWSRVSPIPEYSSGFHVRKTSVQTWKCMDFYMQRLVELILARCWLTGHFKIPLRPLNWLWYMDVHLAF